MSDRKTPFDTTSPGDLRSAPRSLRIIVADDDNDTVLSLMLLLREEGHEVPRRRRFSSFLSRCDLRQVEIKRVGETRVRPYDEPKLFRGVLKDCGKLG